MSKLPPTDTGACGEYRGHSRHRRKGEQPCGPCQAAMTAYEAARAETKNASKRAHRAANPKPRPKAKPQGPKTTQTAAEILVEEIEFFLMCDVGEAAMLRAFNATPQTLEQRLRRAGRPDIIPRVFSHQAMSTEARQHSGQYKTRKTA